MVVTFLLAVVMTESLYHVHWEGMGGDIDRADLQNAEFLSTKMLDPGCVAM
jgi:hypothetical protein